MPVVPMTRQPTTGRKGAMPAEPVVPPPEPYMLMAAAQMHSEGRLIQKADDGK